MSSFRIFETASGIFLSLMYMASENKTKMSTTRRKLKQNECVFSRRLKSAYMSTKRNEAGDMFLTRGLTTMNDLSP